MDNASIGTAALKTLSISGGAVGVSPITINLNTADTGGARTTVQTSGAYAPPATAAVATYTAQNVYAAPGGSEALTISFNGGSVDTTVEAADATIGAAITRINNAIAADPDANGKFIAYDNGTGRLAIRSLTNTDGNISVTGAGEAGRLRHRKRRQPAPTASRPSWSTASL